MRRFLLYLFVITIMPACVIAQSMTLTVFDGTSVDPHVPIACGYAYDQQENQIIYPATRLASMNGAEITQMVFYFDENYGTGVAPNEVATGAFGSWRFSLGEVDVLSLTENFELQAETNQVYEGIMTWNHESKTLTITFDEGYTYNGGNLLVDVFHFPTTFDWCDYYFYGTDVEYDAAYNSAADTYELFLPKVTFTYQPASYQRFVSTDNTLFNIYPNPNNGMFDIDISNIEGDAVCQIINDEGKIIESRAINTTNGDIMSFNYYLAEGVYFIKIIAPKNVYVSRFVVEQ